MKIPEINLLPFSRKMALAVERELAVVRQSFVLVLSVFLLAFLVLTGAKVLLGQSLKQEQEASAALQKAALKQRGQLLDQRIQEFNNSLSTIKTMQKSFTRWTTIVTDLSRALPRGVTLTSFEADKSSGAFSIKGVATTRADLLAFQQTLANVPTFADIRAPVSNLLEREDIHFDLKGTLTLP